MYVMVASDLSPTRLEDGRVIFAPVDDPRCIRKQGGGQCAEPPEPPQYDKDDLGQAYGEHSLSLSL
jgi:hypothetical protein